MENGHPSGAPKFEIGTIFSKSASILWKRRARAVDRQCASVFSTGMANVWITLDLMLRGAACGILFTCALLFAIDSWNQRKSISVIGLAMVLIAYLLVSTPNIMLPTGLAIVMIWVAGTTPVWLYWASLEIFQDDFALAPWQILAGTLVVLGAWFSSLSPFSDMARGALVIVLFLHLLVFVITSADADLVEERRKFRRWFLAAVIVLVILITTIELTEADRNLDPRLLALHAGVFLILSLVFLLWSAQITSDIWVRKPNGTQHFDLDHSPAEIALASKVQDAMNNGLWREERLTVGSLASKLGTQEHRLRRTINRVLGHRNFASFINGYRIDAAKQELADPNNAEKTILSIAYEVGFASIGPFNRAFRQAAEVSPSEFRRNAIEGALVQEGKQPPANRT